MHDLLIAVLLGIIEGVTEFLPVSSTGHLVLGGYFLGLPEGDPTFDIVIQLGAILAVVVVYWQRFMKVGVGLLARDAGAIRFTRNVLLGFIPSMLVGAVAYSAIRALIQDQSVAVVVIAIALILGGLAILFIERTVPPAAKSSVEGLSWKTALGIGVIQCVAMIPGVSRSGGVQLLPRHPDHGRGDDAGLVEGAARTRQRAPDQHRGRLRRVVPGGDRGDPLVRRRHQPAGIRPLRLVPNRGRRIDPAGHRAAIRFDPDLKTGAEITRLPVSSASNIY